MKKSEMLKTLDSAIKNMTNTCLDNRELEYILTQLERKGMLPPSIFTGNHITHNDGSESNEYLNEWEPEDE